MEIPSGALAPQAILDRFSSHLPESWRAVFSQQTVLASTSPKRRHGAELAHQTVHAFQAGPEDETLSPADIAAGKAFFAADIAAQYLSRFSQKKVLAGDLQIGVNGDFQSKIPHEEARNAMQDMVTKARETGIPPSYTVVAGAARATGRHPQRMQVETTTNCAHIILNPDRLADITTTEGYNTYRQTVMQADVLPDGSGSTLESIARELSLPGLTRIGTVDAFLIEGTTIPHYVDGKLNPAFVEAFRWVFWLQAVTIPPEMLRREKKHSDNHFLHSPWINTVVEKVFGEEMSG